MADPGQFAGFEHGDPGQVRRSGSQGRRAAAGRRSAGRSRRKSWPGIATLIVRRRSPVPASWRPNRPRRADRASDASSSWASRPARRWSTACARPVGQQLDDLHAYVDLGLDAPVMDVVNNIPHLLNAVLNVSGGANEVRIERGPTAGTEMPWPAQATCRLSPGASPALVGAGEIAASFACLLFWELAVRLFGVPQYILPPPSGLIARLWANGARSASPPWYTAQPMLMGYALASSSACCSRSASPSRA